MTKALIALVGSVAVLLIGGSLFIAAAPLWGGGMVHVAVRGEDVPNLSLRAPWVVVDSAATLAEWTAPLQLTRRHERQLEAWQPFLNALIDELAECPDATVVAVEDGRDRVLIRKAGRNFEIYVYSATAEVEVSVPARSLRRTLRHVLS